MDKDWRKVRGQKINKTNLNELDWIQNEPIIMSNIITIVTNELSKQDSLDLLDTIILVKSKWLIS